MTCSQSIPRSRLVAHGHFPETRPLGSIVKVARIGAPPLITRPLPVGWRKVSRDTCPRATNSSARRRSAGPAHFSISSRVGARSAAKTVSSGVSAAWSCTHCNPTATTCAQTAPSRPRPHGHLAATARPPCTRTWATRREAPIRTAPARVSPCARVPVTAPEACRRAPSANTSAGAQAITSRLLSSMRGVPKKSPANVSFAGL